MSFHRVCRVIALAGALAAAPGAAARGEGAAGLEGVVNINTASPEELELLAGVGPAKARLIVTYREQHAFRTVEELARVKGIGPRTVRRLRANLVVRGPTTARPGGPRTPSPDAISAPAPPAPPASPSSPSASPSPSPSRSASPSPPPSPSPLPPSPSRSAPTPAGPRCLAHACLPPP